MATISEQLRQILNGPVVAGVGATVDAGLQNDRFHALPWDPTHKTRVEIKDNGESLSILGAPITGTYSSDLEGILRIAIWNVENIFSFTDVAAKAVAVPDDTKAALKSDLVGILFLMLAYGYHAQECRQLTADEAKEAGTVTITDDLKAGIINATRLNRAATFILARMHTKYQTNHAVGGFPMQASMASAVRAFYGISPGSAKSGPAAESLKLITDGLYWALHPANETLLIPSFIHNTGITRTEICTYGPPINFIAIDEYFQIRARTPPASTHHFYVCAAAIKQLDPIGVLAYLPEPTRISDVLTGLQLIDRHGAQLHPAARFWGLERITANQKLVESLCADLGYAVKKLSAASSLALSPILQKEDALDSAWKGLIDSIRAAMDERGKDMLNKEVFDDLKKRIAPIRSELTGIAEIKTFLNTGKVKALPAAEESDEGESDDEDEHPATGM